METQQRKHIYLSYTYIFELTPVSGEKRSVRILTILYLKVTDILEVRTGPQKKAKPQNFRTRPGKSPMNYIFKDTLLNFQGNSVT